MKQKLSEPVQEVYETHPMPEISVYYHKDMRCEGGMGLVNWHENLELFFFSEGEGVVLRQAELFAAKAGDIFVLPANYLHGAGSEKGAQYDCLIIDRELPLRSGLDTSDFDFPAVIRDEKLAALFMAVREAVSSEESDPFRVAQVHGAVLTLLAYLCRTYGEKRKEAFPPARDGVLRAIRYLREHVTESITAEKLAEVAGFSKYHFLRAFKKATSYTVVTYLNALRVEKAKKLLFAGERTVGEVALECGFNNLSYFSKLFRAHTGLSPSAYMRKK